MSFENIYKVSILKWTVQILCSIMTKQLLVSRLKVFRKWISECKHRFEHWWKQKTFSDFNCHSNCMKWLRRSFLQTMSVLADSTWWFESSSVGHFTVWASARCWWGVCSDVTYCMNCNTGQIAELLSLVTYSKGVVDTNTQVAKWSEVKRTILMVLSEFILGLKLIWGSVVWVFFLTLRSIVKSLGFFLTTQSCFSRLKIFDQGTLSTLL